MRHEAIEMVCAHVPQSREPPSHLGGVLGASAYAHIINPPSRFLGLPIALPSFHDFFFFDLSRCFLRLGQDTRQCYHVTVGGV